MTLFTLKHEKKLEDHLGFIEESHPFGIYSLSIVVGILASLSTIGFVKFYEFLSKFIYFSSTADFVQIAKITPLWYYAIILIVGGLLIGLLIYHFTPYHGHGQGFPYLLYSYRHNSYITVREGIFSSLASALSLGIGAMVGREMPAIFFTCAVTSWLCQVFHLKGHTFRILIAAAIGTSLATSLHSCFVGIFFVIEIISFSLTALDLLPIAVAIFTGVLVREYFTQLLPPITLNFEIAHSEIQLLNFIILGVICGLLAYFFIKTLTITIKSTFMSKIPNYFWPMIGGIGLTLIAIRYPEALGLGFWDINLLAQNTHNFYPLLMILIAKYAAVIFSLGFGFSGGVFTPAAFWGLCIGSLFAITCTTLFPHSSLSIPTYTLAGAAAFTGAVLGAPVTMTLFAFEVTHNIEATLNIFIVTFVAQLVMKCLHAKSFFQTQYTFLFDRCE